MPLDSAERLYLERQVTLARAILVALALLVLLETPGESYREASASGNRYARFVGRTHTDQPLRRNQFLHQLA